MPETDVIPTSASVVSVGKGVRYIGDHCYGYNNYEAETSPSNKLDFISGSGYIMGEFSLGSLINPTDPTQGKRSIAQIQFNGATVMTMINDGAAVDSITPNIVRLIIPPFTKVGVLIKGQTDSSSYTGAIAFTGRVYGAE